MGRSSSSRLLQGLTSGLLGESFMKKSMRDRLAIRFGQLIAIAEGRIAILAVVMIVLLLTRTLWGR
jgi:ABC-type Mn2+/Zn2+ transport system permease subunit